MTMSLYTLVVIKLIYFYTQNMFKIFLTYSSYLTLLLAVLSLWLSSSHKARLQPWQLFCLIALLLAFLAHQITLVAIAVVLFFYYLVQKYHSLSSSSPLLKLILWFGIFSLGVALELNKIPGFYSLPILNKVQFTPDAIPFSLSFNLGSIIVGIIILGTMLSLARRAKEWKKIATQVLLRFPLPFIVLLLSSLALGYVKWEPKIPSSLPIWIISNLFFTCVAEEGLFRGFVQNLLSKINFKYSPLLALIISALSFGLLHYKGGINYILLAAVAGLFYGWIYQATKKIEASILTHFLVNLTHLLFFTYPALMK